MDSGVATVPWVGFKLRQETDDGRVFICGQVVPRADLAEPAVNIHVRLLERLVNEVSAHSGTPLGCWEGAPMTEFQWMPEPEEPHSDTGSEGRPS